MNNKILGQAGEDAAARFLLRQGYQVLCRNYRVRSGEIDIIAREGATLVHRLSSPHPHLSRLSLRRRRQVSRRNSLRPHSPSSPSLSSRRRITVSTISSLMLGSIRIRMLRARSIRVRMRMPTAELTTTSTAVSTTISTATNTIISTITSTTISTASTRRAGLRTTAISRGKTRRRAVKAKSRKLPVEKAARRAC